MTKDRKRITIEFKGDYMDDELWEALSKHSNKASIVKDMLKGLVPLPNLNKEDK